MKDELTHKAAELFGVSDEEVTSDQRDFARAWTFGDMIDYRKLGERYGRSAEEALMQSFESCGTTFKYTIPTESVQIVVRDEIGIRSVGDVPFQALLDFVAQCYVRPMTIAKISSMTTEGLLGAFVDDPGEDLEDEEDEEDSYGNVT